MPSLKPDQGVGGAATPQAPEEAADASFEAHDARLAAELRLYERARAGSPGFEYGHDESYSPGYHQGGVRFGFFNAKDAPMAAVPASPGGGEADDKT